MSSTPAPAFLHRPVMVKEVLDILAPAPAGTLVDATVGGGGHAEALLEAHSHLSVLGIDQDPDAVEGARSRLEPFGGRAQVREARFDRLAAVIQEVGAAPVSAVLFDLGVSSPQLDRAERGFSHRLDAPLDMRMGPTAARSAADIVNHADRAELARLLSSLGDERHAGRVANAIVAARPITTTAELAEVVTRAIPAATRRRGGHPARRTFLALRMAVNEELDVLPPALDQALEILIPGGRMVVISYHSGEDRIVKASMRRAARGGCTCPSALPCVCGAVPTARLLRRPAWTPTPAEVAINPRSRSARLRAVEKLLPTSTEPGRDRR